MKVFSRSRRAVGVAMVAGAFVLALAGGAGADTENGTLPGGTEITVSIGNPLDGSVHPPGNIAVDGTASVGEGQAVANTRLIYVIDVSGSTSASCSGGQPTVLQCEIDGLVALNQAAIAEGSIADVGVVAFGTTAAQGDVGPAAGDQTITGPGTDANAAGGPDVEEVISSAFIGGGLNVFTVKNVGGNTNFEAAVQQANLLAAAGAPPANVLVVFVSDGVATTGGDAIDDANAAPDAVDYHTFAIGAGSSCSNTGGGRGSLQQIADATEEAGEDLNCTVVIDPTDLVDVLPGIVASELTQLDIQVDGGAFSPIGNAFINPDLPQPGPVAATYGSGLAVNLVAPGPHTICVRATGSDAGGTGTLTDCHTITIEEPNGPPDCSGLTANPNLLWPPNHKFHTITVGGATDPDGDPIQLMITGVTQDEPLNAGGDGNTSPDAVILSKTQVNVRAERSGQEDGRVYRIHVIVRDSHGATCTGYATVGVPHDQGGGSTPIDSAPPSYNSLAP